MKRKIFFISVIILLAGIIIFGAGQFAPIGNIINIFTEPRPVLVVQNLHTEKINISKEACAYSITGTLTNKGQTPAKTIEILCGRAWYPSVISSNNVLAHEFFETLGSYQKRSFTVTIEYACFPEVRFDCTASCKNCRSSKLPFTLRNT